MAEMRFADVYTIGPRGRKRGNKKSISQIRRFCYTIPNGRRIASIVIIV